MYFKIEKSSELGKELQRCIDVEKTGKEKAFEIMKKYGADGIISHSIWGGLEAFVFPRGVDTSRFKKWGKTNDNRQMYAPKKKEKTIINDFESIGEITRDEWCKMLGLPWKFSPGFTQGNEMCFGVSIRDSWIKEFKKNNDMIEITYTEFNILQGAE